MIFAELSTEVWMALIGLGVIVANGTFSILKMIAQERLASNREARVADKVEEVKVTAEHVAEKAEQAAEQVKDALIKSNGGQSEKLIEIAKAVGVPSPGTK